MKIALFNCNMRSVPPKKSGAIEKIIYYLCTGLSQRGHQVTLFSTGDSVSGPNIELVSVYPHEIEMMDIPDIEKYKLNEKLTLELGKKLVERQNEFDIVHNHCLDVAVPIFSSIQTNLVSTIHETLNFDSIDRLTKYKSLNYISVSYSQRKPFPELNYVSNIYNAVDAEQYPKPKSANDYMVFVGRISQQKAPHLAILAAKRLQKKLYLLGKYKDESREAEYYHKIFLPILKENKNFAEWIGEVDEKTVNQYFNNATCSLHPVNYRDSCPLSPLESMAAGCPVVAFNKGAFSETIVEGKTGFLAEDIEEMVSKIKKIDSIDRDYCRKHVEKNFDKNTMVENYIETYKAVIN